MTDLPTAFAAGVGGGVATLVYSLAERYRGLEPRLDETRTERAVRVLSRVAWLRVAIILLVAGVVAHTVWYGLDDGVAWAASRWSG